MDTVPAHNPKKMDAWVLLIFFFLQMCSSLLVMRENFEQQSKDNSALA